MNCHINEMLNEKAISLLELDNKLGSQHSRLKANKT